jgi:hypothetical protein
MNRDKRLYFDDLHVGQRFTSGTHVIDETQIKAPTACPAREGSWTLDDRKSEGLIMCKSAMGQCRRAT